MFYGATFNSRGCARLEKGGGACDERISDSARVPSQRYGRSRSALGSFTAGWTRVRRIKMKRHGSTGCWEMALPDAPGRKTTDGRRGGTMRKNDDTRETQRGSLSKLTWPPRNDIVFVLQ